MYAMSYKQGQERVVALMEGNDPETMVPACPEWSATDVVRHLAGLSSDISHDVFDGFASEEWTDQQIRDRADMTIDQVITEWNASIDGAGSILDDVASSDQPRLVPSALGMIPTTILGAMAISDILHHEFDLRNAFGDSSGRDLIEVHVAAAGHVRSLRSLFAAHGLPTLRVESTDSGQGWDVGRDEPVATVRASSFELMRSIGGRRTRDEILALEWDGDAEVFVDHMVLPHLAMRDTSLGE
jgi:uncharacterized protein (TIGR03083 family)